ncbi:alpha/beta hydrolase fold domain-containing protein [Nocardia sp. NPDC059246]|uniref:alpha/beta hydrolase fold domain-containing protein n=1 Tax=unclassified Nocardia TaxID=2637762 RepID=UPI0036773EE3
MSVRAAAARQLAKWARINRIMASPEALDKAIKADRERTRDGVTPPAAVSRRYSVRVEQTCGHQVYRIAPLTRAPTRRLIYLHGGGCVTEILPAHWYFVADLVRQLNCEAIVPLYPLAPEHHALDMNSMLLAVYRDEVQGRGAGGLTLMGDSGGGGLALLLAMNARDDGLPQPDRISLLFPALDVSFTNPGIADLAQFDVVLQLPGIQHSGRLLAGEQLDVKDPRVSPLYGDLTDLAEISVWTGTYDLTLPDSLLLREKAEAQGLPLDFHLYPRMTHGWIMAPRWAVPEAGRARDQLVEYLSTEPAIRRR